MMRVAWYLTIMVALQFGTVVLGSFETKKESYWFPPEYCKPPKGKIVRVGPDKNKYACECEPCYWGPQCENLRCRNGGDLEKSWRGEFSCKCPREFNGTCCEEVNCWGRFKMKSRFEKKDTCECTNPRQYGPKCENAKCENGGTADGMGGCLCAISHKGKFCGGVNCWNDGRFSEVDDRCECPQFTYGSYCENVNCTNGGIQSADRRKCECKKNFYGRSCEKIYCYHGESRPGARCICYDRHFSGTFCEQVTCENGGKPAKGGPKVCDCLVPLLFEGRYCESFSALFYSAVAVTISIIFIICCLCVRWRYKHKIDMAEEMARRQKLLEQEKKRLEVLQSGTWHYSPTLMRKSINATEDPLKSPDSPTFKRYWPSPWAMAEQEEDNKYYEIDSYKKTKSGTRNNNGKTFFFEKLDLQNGSAGVPKSGSRNKLGSVGSTPFESPDHSLRNSPTSSRKALISDHSTFSIAPRDQLSLKDLPSIKANMHAKNASNLVSEKPNVV